MSTTTNLQIGDKVIYTNPQGVCWGERTVVGTEAPYTPGGAARYYIAPTDTPWFAVSEECLAKIPSNKDAQAR